jgi:two-component sensor histidine kinase
MKAKPHGRQAERLRALASYEVLDTDREQDFDEVVALASKLCGTAISVVNLIDADRQWFKAEVGLGTRETPLDTSLCAHAILEDDFVEIPDTRDDPRMADNPLVQGDPGLRFYAGALLVAEDGLPLGTLCVLDYSPRRLTPLQRDTLRVLAKQVMAQLDLRRALRRAEVLRLEVDHRVKNSLQTLSTLARLQARGAANEAVAEALADMQHRIQAVAMLHEQLYLTDAGGRIDLAAYLAKLSDYLQKTAPPGVAIVLAAEPTDVSSKQAALAGTLVNEFVANAIKHAFPDGRSGTIRVCLEPGPDHSVTLTLADDGIGLPTGVVPNKGLGMKILTTIGQQLGGAVDMAPGTTGTQLRLTFTPEP